MLGLILRQPWFPMRRQQLMVVAVQRSTPGHADLVVRDICSVPEAGCGTASCETVLDGFHP